jgi:hypothetical protein
MNKSRNESLTLTLRYKCDGAYLATADWIPSVGYEKKDLGAHPLSLHVGVLRRWLL